VNIKGLNNGFATGIIALIVVLAGGIITVLHPESLSFSQYIKDVAIGCGLLGIAHGVDGNSRP
jgi:hypothetical protein